MTNSHHCTTLNLRYKLPLSNKELATLDMYYSLYDSKKFIKVLGTSCIVLSIKESKFAHLSYTELKIDIKLQQALTLKDK